MTQSKWKKTIIKNDARDEHLSMTDVKTNSLIDADRRVKNEKICRSARNPKLFARYLKSKQLK
jgi:hypothetical protein